MRRICGFVLGLLLVTTMVMAEGKAEPASGSSGVMQFKWYQQEPPGHPWTDVGQIICDEIANRSNGRIKIVQYHSGSLGTQQEGVNMLRSGAVQLMTVGATIFNGFDEDIMVLGVPYLFRDTNHMIRVMDKIGLELTAKITKASGIRYLDTWLFGIRQVTTKGIPATKPEDLNGVKIRCMDIPVFKDSVASLGANPVPVNYSELYMALQTGVVKGQENPANAIYTQKFYEVQDYVILTEHMVHSGQVWINEKTWQGLSEADQNLITTVFHEYRAVINQKILDQSDQLLAKWEKEGTMKIIKPDKAAFQKYSEAYMDKIYGAKWGAIIKKIKAIQ